MMENLAKALCAFQAEVVSAAKDSKNPHFRADYASLASVIKTVQRGTKHGLCFTQLVDSAPEGRPVVVTHLYHVSGESIEAVTPLLVGKNDMQGLGSAISYARRYALLGIYGLAADDDDGNAAVSSRGGSPVSASNSSEVGGGPPAAASDPFSFDAPSTPSKPYQALLDKIDEQESPDALKALYGAHKDAIEAMDEEDRADVVGAFKAAKERMNLNG